MMEPYVFISYARRDEAFVDRLAADLQREGIRVWRDVEQIEPGEQWQQAITDALNKAVALLYVSSRHSETSSWMRQELQAFFETSRRIIPVIIDDAGKKALPINLRRFQWVDFRESYDLAFRQILSVFPESVKSASPLKTFKKRSEGYLFISYAKEDTDS